LLERRHMTRYDFGAIAEVIDLDSREDIIVVTRDLSLSGCFVKTCTPFPPGTEVRVRIAYAGADFAATGSVTENITREGMGIEFVEIEPEHQATIVEWLSLSPLSAEACGAPQAVQMRNRLSRREQPRALPSQEQRPKPARPAPFAHQFLESARNFWKSRDATRH
jgi:hypothetical protein